MIKLNKLKAFALLALLLAVTSCSTFNHKFEQSSEDPLLYQNLYCPKTFDWKAVSEGAWYFSYCNRDFPVKWHAVKIDLSNPNLKIHAFPDSTVKYIQKDGKKTEFFTGLRPADFNSSFESDIFINTSPFAGKDGSWNIWAKLTSTRKIIGIHKFEGIEFAPPVQSYAALCFLRSKEGFSAHILPAQTKESLVEFEYAFGGFFSILQDGVIQPFEYISHDSRTACGVSKDKKTLYLLVVEGEQLSKSRGLSYPECAVIFKVMGASDAMQMDGGGSASMYVNRKNVQSYTVRRYNASFLGFSF
ncbi:MAG: phosphodiester glycosidase family protein [Treponema sp.]|nr:phosphodiester glycosidase family protein [Treponema sp.]